MYAIGGRELSADSNSAAVERYDSLRGRWKRRSNMPTASGSLGAAAVNRQLVAVGGEASTTIIARVQDYDLATHRWSQLRALPSPRHGVSVVALGHTLCAIGGAKAPGHTDSTGEADALDFGTH